LDLCGPKWRAGDEACLLVSGRHALPLVSVHVYRPWRKLPLSACGCKKFQIDALGDHLCTCTAHSGAKKAHDDGRLSNSMTSFTQHTKRKRNRWLGARVGDLGTLNCLVTSRNAAGPVPSVLDLRIAHERWGSSSDPSINGHLHYPNDVDRPLNEAVVDKIRAYRADYNNRPSNTQELSLRNLPVDSSTSAARGSPHSSKPKWATSSPRLRLYVSF
jgi:hypothetical protein